MVHTYLTSPTQLKFRDVNEPPYGNETSFVNINSLTAKEWASTSDTVMVCVVLYIKAASKDSKLSFYSRTDRQVNTSYDKMIVAMDVNAPAGQNIVIFLLGGGQNECFFRNCIRMRDTGVLGKNTLIFIIVYIILGSY